MNMAEPNIFGDQFNCSVCLGQMTDPVTIPCGHSYCMICIKDYWARDDQKGVYSCPMLQMFIKRPDLNKNTIMAEMIEQLKMIQIPGRLHAGPAEQKQLEEAQRKYQKIIQLTDKNLQMLREDVKSYKHYIETQLIKDQKSAVSQAKRLLERETNEPGRTDAELKKHLLTRDHISLMQSLRSLSDSGSLYGETLEDFRKVRMQNITGIAPDSLFRTLPKTSPFSVALPWSGSTSTSHSLPWSITFPLLLHSYGLTAQKPQPRAFTSSDSQPRSLIELNPRFRTPTAPESKFSNVVEELKYRFLEKK
ncbi:uncharacterized protein [Misgurnus anguillicaudatus]|uniref:uncharacterized protein n=1 Tax=Misgurnus anguillicaudatus TaxID=75329 RepID=UPI003CCFD0AC